MADNERDDDASPLQRAAAFFDALRAGSTYDAAALDGLELIDASPGRVLCRVVCAPQHANSYGTMHGGCIGEWWAGAL